MLLHQQLMIHIYKSYTYKFAKPSGYLKASQLKFIDVDFVQVNNNQSIDLFQNQIMWCLNCHNDVMSLEIFALHTRLKKVSLLTINQMA